MPSLDAWDQFFWPPAAAVPRAFTEAEQYGYHCGQAIDLGPVMPAAQLRVTDKARTYLCVARALVFKGSVLAYNPARDEAEWVPVCGLAYDLTWAEERSTVALANYVPHVSQEAAWIARLGAHRLVSWPADSSTSEEEEQEEKRNRRKRTLCHRLLMWSPSKVKGMRMRSGEWTRRMSRSQIGSAHETGRQSWGKRRDWHMKTCSQIPTPWLMAAPQDVRPCMSWGHKWRQQWRCM